MTVGPTKLVIPPDSELARYLRDAGEYLEVDTGEHVYRLYVDRALVQPPTAEQVVRAQAAIRSATGGWKGLIDAEAFKRSVAERRRSGSRPSVSL